MMRFVITTPQVLKAPLAQQADLPYQDRVKPCNFIMSPLTDPNEYPADVIDRHHYTLIGPFSEDSSQWYPP